MGGKFWCRKDDKFEVVCSAPSVNLTQVGNAIVPIPYPVVSKSKLKISTNTVPYILLSGKEAFVKRSHTTKVKGDEKGSKGGVVSGTVSEKAEPITFDATVKGDGDFMIRDAEQFFMQNKNTVGKMTTTLGGSGSAVNAGGDVSGASSPADIGGQGSDAWSQALNALKDPMGAYAKLQDMKSKYDTVAGMINGEIPFSAAGLAGAVGGLTGNQSLMQASSMLSQAETAEKMLSGEIPFSPAFAMGLAGSATGNPSLMNAAQTVGQAEGYYHTIDNAYGGQGRTPSFNNAQSSIPKNATSKPSASALTKMIKSDTVNNFGKTLLGAMSSKEKPTLSTAMSGLGSLMGSPILLATAQSIYAYAFPPLLGVFSIDLNLRYVSDLFYQGVFGNNRRHSYEKQFYWLKGDNYRLDLADGRWFRFIKQEDGSFKDIGSLGVEIKQIDEQTFELYYLKTAMTEHYHKKYLREIEDSNGNKIELSYQTTINPKVALLKEIKNSSKASWTFAYNEDELVRSITDHAGRVWSFQYDKEKYLSLIVFNKALEESYGYEKIERRNLPKQYLLSSVKGHSESIKLSFSYNAQGEVCGYSEDEQQYRYVWHNLEQVEKQNASGTSIIYGLDESKRVSAITYPDKSYVQETWDNEKGIAKIKTRGGASFEKSYDKQGRLLSVVKNEELIESFEYEALNPKPIVHTTEGKTTKYAYDKAYNLIALILSQESKHTYAYTKEGLLSSSQDALGHEVLYEYNVQGMLSKQTDALNNPKTFEYDRLSRLRSVTLANQQSHHYEYNQNNQIVKYTNPQSESMEFAYSKSGKLVSLKDPAKRKTVFRYDEYERVIAKVYPYMEEEERQVEYYSYNVDNSLSSMTRVDGTILYFNYDENKNIVKILADNQEGEVESLAYTYDTLSNLVKAVSNNNRVLLEYDRDLNLNAQTQNGVEVQSLYDEKHKQLESITFLNHTQNYQYDTQNRLSEVINNQEEKFEFKYDENAVLKQRKYPNKTKENYHYDEAYNLVEIEAKENHIRYSYNALGEIETKGNRKDEDAKLYRYNARGELIQAGRDNFSYSTAGNRIEEGWEYNYQNQLTQNHQYLYSYDARGNLQSKRDKEKQEQTNYTFNLFNQLLKVVKTNSKQECLEAYYYAYDALNRRVKKTEIKNQKETTYYYLYDKYNIIAILDKNKEKLATIVHDPKIDTPLSITTHQNPLRELTEVEESYYDDLAREEKNFVDQKRRERTYYYNRDHQGSIHNLSDKDGKVVESFRYDDSYGCITEHIKTKETLNPYCYTGREFETDELYYYRARYYDPSIGRFISSDPIEFLAGDFNFFRYVGNEPVGWVDPFGLEGYWSATVDSWEKDWDDYGKNRETIAGRDDQAWYSDTLQHVGGAIGFVTEGIGSMINNEKTQELASEGMDKLNEATEYVENTETYQQIEQTGNELYTDFRNDNPNAAAAIDYANTKVAEGKAYAGKKINEGMEYAGEEYNAWANENPTAAANLSAGGQIASFVPIGKAVGLAGKGIKKVIKANKLGSEKKSGVPKANESKANKDGKNGVPKVAKNPQVNKLDEHPDLKKNVREDGTTEYIDKKNGKVIAEVDKDGLLSYKYDGFGGDIKMDSDKTTTVLGKFHDPIDDGKGCKYFLGDKDSGVDGLPDGTFSRGSGKENLGGLNSLDVPEYDGIIEKEMLRTGVTDTTKLDKNSWKNINDEFWDDYNEPFLEDAFKRGDNIRLVSDPVKARSGTYRSELRRINGEDGRTGLADKYGYRYDELTTTYVKK